MIDSPGKSESSLELSNSILIVDDDFAMRHIMKNMLAQFTDFQLLEAHNGMKAVDLIMEFLPRLVFLDVSMPVLNGVEVLEYLKKVELVDKIRVIMCTAEGNIKTVKRALELGAVDYIKKPFEPQTIINKTNKWLSHQE